MDSSHDNDSAGTQRPGRDTVRVYNSPRLGPVTALKTAARRLLRRE